MSAEGQAARYWQRRARGQCVRCLRSATHGVRCFRCALWVAAWKRQQYATAKQTGQRAGMTETLNAGDDVTCTQTDTNRQ